MIALGSCICWFLIIAWIYPMTIFDKRYEYFIRAFPVFWIIVIFPPLGYFLFILLAIYVYRTWKKETK